MFDKVLVPLDITHPESWQNALPAARRCAGPEGEVHLLGIVHDLGSAVVSTFLPEDFEQKSMETLKAQLVDLAQAELPAGDANHTHVAHGHVPEAILRVAEQIGAALIVMAAHPPNDLQSMLVGSNASKVVRHSPIPVLVMK